MLLCTSRGFKPTLGAFLNFSATYLNFTFVCACLCMDVYMPQHTCGDQRQLLGVLSLYDLVHGNQT